MEEEHLEIRAIGWQRGGVSGSFSRTYASLFGAAGKP